MKQKRKFPRNLFGPKTAALVIVIIMALADLLTMEDMFTQLGCSDHLFAFGWRFTISGSFVYSVIMATLLEANPWFLGMSASAIWDRKLKKTNHRTGAEVGVVLSLAGLVGSWMLVIAMRCFIIIKNGGYAQYIDSPYGGFALDLCLAIMPVLTSILATTVSWTAFRSEQEAAEATAGAEEDA